MSVLKGIQKWVRGIGEKSAIYSLHCDEIGLTQIVRCAASTETVQLSWSEVKNVFAYERDCFAVDQIRLLIEGTDGIRRIEVTEDDVG
jgi:hypothetical protein